MKRVKKEKVIKDKKVLMEMLLKVRKVMTTQQKEIKVKKDKMDLLDRLVFLQVL